MGDYITLSHWIEFPAAEDAASGLDFLLSSSGAFFREHDCWGIHAGHLSERLIGVELMASKYGIDVNYHGWLSSKLPTAILHVSSQAGDPEDYDAGYLATTKKTGSFQFSVNRAFVLGQYEAVPSEAFLSGLDLRPFTSTIAGSRVEPWLDRPGLVFSAPEILGQEFLQQKGSFLNSFVACSMEALANLPEPDRSLYWALAHESKEHGVIPFALLNASPDADLIESYYLLSLCNTKGWQYRGSHPDFWNPKLKDFFGKH